MESVIEASPKKPAICPFCTQNMTYKGDGRYVCPTGCGEYLREQVDEDPEPKVTTQTHARQYWPELFEGTTGRMRHGMKGVAELELGTADVAGPCQGHGGKGGGGKGGRGKSQARQKQDAWNRKVSPGRFIRSVRVG